jgi:serine/threonine-protein kinase HipA
VLALSKQLPVAARKLQADETRGFARHALVEQITALIEQRCALTVKRLSETGLNKASVEASL